MACMGEKWTNCVLVLVSNRAWCDGNGCDAQAQVGTAWLTLQRLLGAADAGDGAAAEAWLLALLRASIERELAEHASVRCLP